MVNPSKQKGTAFETAIVGYLREHGFPYAERRALHGNHDRGDVAGVPGWVLELKAEKKIDLAGYVAEVEVERVNDGAQFGAAVVKRRGKPTRDAYVVMDLASFCELIR